MYTRSSVRIAGVMTLQNAMDYGMAVLCCSAERDAVFLRQPQLYLQQQMDYNQEDDEDVDWKQQQDTRRDEQQRHMNLVGS